MGACSKDGKCENKDEGLNFGVIVHTREEAPDQEKTVRGEAPCRACFLCCFVTTDQIPMSSVSTQREVTHNLMVSLIWVNVFHIFGCCRLFPHIPRPPTALRLLFAQSTGFGAWCAETESRCWRNRNVGVHSRVSAGLFLSIG